MSLGTRIAMALTALPDVGPWAGWPKKVHDPGLPSGDRAVVAIGLGQPSWTFVRLFDLPSVTHDVAAAAVPANRPGRLRRG